MKIKILRSTANPAQFWWKWAGLAVLFSRQILNGSQDFFLFNILIFIYFFEYETIETHARAFLTLNILFIGTVNTALQSSVDRSEIFAQICICISYLNIALVGTHFGRFRVCIIYSMLKVRKYKLFNKLYAVRILP